MSDLGAQLATARLVRFPRLLVALAVIQLPLLAAAVVVAILQRWSTLGMIAAPYVAARSRGSPSPASTHVHRSFLRAYQLHPEPASLGRAEHPMTERVQQIVALRGAGGGDELGEPRNNASYRPPRFVGVLEPSIWSSARPERPDRIPELAARNAGPHITPGIPIRPSRPRSHPRARG